MNEVSPWVATAQADIANGKLLLEQNLKGYTFRVCNSGDSLWIVASWPDTGSMAFRAAFAMSSDFEVTNILHDGDNILIALATRLGNYEVRIDFPDATIPLLHYTTNFTSNFPMLIPYWPRDIIPLTAHGQIGNTAGKVHVKQVGSRSGLLFASMTRPKTGAVFYFQNLTALSEYCDATASSLAEAVGGQWPEIGFRLPAATQQPVLAGKKFTISDAYVLLDTVMPEDEIAAATQFLGHLAKIYRVVPKPNTHYCDWPGISEKALTDLTLNKGCWSYAASHPYLNAYLCDYKTPAEIMVQLAVLTAINEHGAWTGEKYPVVGELKDGLEAFYDPKLKTLSRWLPSQRGELDESEEQKSAMTMDSWYLHHPLLSLSKLALGGDRKAKKLLLDSLEYAILVAHRFDYEWPVFYKMDTLEILKAETEPGKGGEKDVAGGYALLMINVWKITKDQRYLDEAVKAAKKLRQNGLDIFYQANMTAFSALAMLRLYKETKNTFYLETSYLCLAGIFKNVQLWECDYGSAKHFKNFFGVFPLNNAPYKAAYEEMEVYAALNDYFKEAAAMKAPILSALKTLLPEFVKYSINRLSSYYPPLLPKEILSDVVKTGEIDPQLWIPIEDLYDGWEKHGKVGQEVYGAGVGFGIVPRQYVKVKGEHFKIFTNYPITTPRHTAKKALAFSVLGTSFFNAALVLLGDGEKVLPKITVTSKMGRKSSVLQPVKSSGSSIEYQVSGGATLTVEWN